jgi:polar amino acid transport system substrate-binding protein
MRLTIIAFILCFLNTPYASSTEKLKVAFGNTLAPWVISDNHSGIIIDIIKQALEPLGYEIENIYLPYARRLKSYHLGLVDVVSDINTNTIENERLQGFFSDAAYAYENFAFTLKKNNYHLKKISDLGDLRLLSWQGAIAHLGDEYSEMATNNPFYSEHHDQSLQIKMLFLERVDAVQLDMEIFKYYRTKVQKLAEIDASQDIDQFALFGKSPNGFLFRSIKIRDDFNKQLKILKESGQYEKILSSYSSRH